MSEADLVEGLADLLDRPVLGGGWIGGGAAQRALWHVRLLRQHEQPAVWVQIDAGAAPSSSVTDRFCRLRMASPSVSPRLMRPMPSPRSARSSPSSDNIKEAMRRA